MLFIYFSIMMIYFSNRKQKAKARHEEIVALENSFCLCYVVNKIARIYENIVIRI